MFRFLKLNLLVRTTISIVLLGLFVTSPGLAQHRRTNPSGSHPSVTRPGMSPNTRALVEEAIGVVCSDAKLDPKGSEAIDDMQARPSLPLQSTEAQAGADRAQRLLPVAKNFVISSLKELVTEYGLADSRSFSTRVDQAIVRVQNVRRIRPDMDARDNASVFLSRPHTITFGTIFLAGLPSDEGMISVISHELMHIADGDNDSLRPLVTLVANKASKLTGLEIHGQRGEELTCDLIGAMAAHSYVIETPGYESISRRLARSVEHNCVDLDEGDEDHLSPRNTIRALLAIAPGLVREIVNDRLDAPQAKSKS